MRLILSYLALIFYIKKATECASIVKLPRAILEGWMSGLNQRFTKPSFLYWNRGFESHSLRSYKNQALWCRFFVERREVHKPALMYGGIRMGAVMFF